MRDGFGCDISFGTGGIRAVTGAGTNCMNIYVVRRITGGLAKYVLEQPDGAAKGIVIAYDTRKYSYEFAW